MRCASAHRLHAPPTAFQVSPATLGVFVTPPSPFAFTNGSSSRELRPPSEFDETSPPPHRQVEQLLPRGFLASSRHRYRMSARHDGYQPAAAIRPQVFSTSRRFHPCVASRACFIPQARPGFPLQGLPLPRSRTAFRRPLPSCRYRRPSSLAGERPTIRLQGFAPLGNPLRTDRRLNRAGLATLLGFTLSRVSLPRS
jgi:hypothetical protein